MTTPAEPCAECGFAWDLGRDDAVAIVESAPRWFAKAFEGAAWVTPPAGTWTAVGYLWHVVDVLRFSTERFWVLALDPRAGLRSWDADEMARLRGSDGLSSRVGLRALEAAVEDWRVALAATPAFVTAVHPTFGVMDAAYVARRNAHEIVHHVMDVRRQRAA